MDDLCAFLDELLAWTMPLADVPVTYAAEDRVPVDTARAPYLELGFHAEGEPAEMAAGEHRVRTVPGTLVGLNAHFGNRGLPQGKWAYWCVSFATPVGGPLADLGARPLLLAATVPNPGRVRDQYEAVARQFSRRTGCHPVRLKAEVLLLLACLREELDPRNPARAEGARAVEAAADLLHRRFADPGLRLDDVAAAVGVSPPHLCRLFRRERAESPMAMLGRLRLERAAELLGRTHLDVGEIAFAVGYSDRLYFSRMFRRFAGCSPTEFRRRRPADPAPGALQVRVRAAR